jgi:hypothetical protein
MDTELLTSHFKKIGADLRIRSASELPRRRRPGDYSINIANTRKGESFELVLAEDHFNARVIDTDPADRHLLLMVDDGTPRNRQKFLCGHDERHWFVAGVGDAVSSIRQAKESLKPPAVQAEQDRKGVKTKDRNRRRNAAFTRQGEWFFVPAPDLEPDERLILHNEPIRRGRGKPHMVEFLFRRGGVSVRVCRQYPNGLTEGEYANLIRRDPDKAKLAWTNMMREPEAFAMGRVRHPDHKTIVLRGWHRILPNNEGHATNVAFLD